MTSTTARAPSARLIGTPRWQLFVAVQLVIMISGASWAGYRASLIARRTALPPIRQVPLQVRPLYDYDVVVTDDQLRRTLTKLMPRDRGAETRINNVDHALRFWGVQARFDAPGTLSGEAMRRLLVDHRGFRQRYGDQQSPLLIDAPRGVRVRTKEGPTTSSHTDHTLAGLAEVGTPLDFPIVTSTRNTTFREMLEQALRDFSLNQAEFEWSAIAFALCLEPTPSWYTSEGQQITFDRLATRMMREEMPLGVCFGNHRLHALVIFLRVDDHARILSDTRRREITEYLKGMTARLVATQHSMGFWNDEWPDRAPQSLEPTDVEGDRLGDRLIATGHALEWWSLAPQEVHPPRHVLANAGQWLARTIGELTEDEVQANYTFLSHAGRALALWRGRWPAEVELSEP